MKKVLTLMVAALVAISVHAAQTYEEAVSTGNKELKGKNYDAAATAFDEAVKLAEKPTDKASAYFKAGEAMRYAKKYDEATEYFKKMLAVDESSPTQKSLAQYRLGLCCYAQKKYPETIAEMEKISDIDKAHKSHIALAKRYIGFAQYNSKDYDAAAKTFGEIANDESAT